MYTAPTSLTALMADVQTIMTGLGIWELFKVSLGAMITLGLAFAALQIVALVRR